MDHIAILNPKLAKIEDVLSGAKTIESRWYKNKVTPWNKISIGDSVYFKKSGGRVEAVSSVYKIIQLDNPTNIELREVIDRYRGSGMINLRGSTDDILKWAEGKRYIILIFLKNPISIESFDINKSGFGISAAWLCVSNIDDIKK